MFSLAVHDFFDERSLYGKRSIATRTICSLFASSAVLLSVIVSGRLLIIHSALIRYSMAAKQLFQDSWVSTHNGISGCCGAINMVDSTWVWGLYPIDENHTRLITRVRVKYHWLSPTIIFGLLVEFTDIIMMRKCMLGIQRRAQDLRIGYNLERQIEG